MLTLEHAVSESSLTTWLLRLRENDPQALPRLLPLVYDELRALAHAQLRRERTGHTLGTTALVHEAYLKLARREKLQPEDRRHFFAIAAQCMRRVLIDYARSRKRIKRGAGLDAVPLDDVASFLSDEAVLGVSLKTVQRDWIVAQAWLRKEIRLQLAPLDSAGRVAP
jgi:RNA polymerase sigma factor (TIGR02999 family)